MTDTKQHPLEKIAGMTKTVTPPGSGVDVVIRKLDMDVIAQDLMLSTMKSADLLQVASTYASEVNEATGQEAASRHLASAVNQVELLKAIRAGMLREAVIRPTLDELRTEVYGGRADSSDLGMGPDYSFLVNAIEEFNNEGGEADKDAGLEVAATFPEKVGASPTQPS